MQDDSEQIEELEFKHQHSDFRSHCLNYSSKLPVKTQTSIIIKV